MIENLAYLITLLIFTILPSVYAWSKHYRFFMKYKIFFAVVLVISTIVGYVWDYIAVQDRVWYFPNVLGVWIGGLPLEEWLFFWLSSMSIVSITLAMIRSGKK